MDEMNLSLNGTTWYNSKGDHFTVQDIIMDGSTFSVTTTDGRIISADKMNEYLQSNKPIDFEEYNSPDISNIETSNESLNSLLDNSYIENPSKELSENLDYNIIDRALKDKIRDTDVSIAVSCEFPKTEVDILTNILKISKESIVDYLNTNLENSLKNKLKDAIREYLDAKIDL